MLRFLCLVAVVAISTSLRAESPPTVADLVKQLGDAKFANREAAQKALLARGEAVAPELNKIDKSTDAETTERVRKILYALVGYKDDIRRLLSKVQYGKDKTPGGYELAIGDAYLLFPERTLALIDRTLAAEGAGLQGNALIESRPNTPLFDMVRGDLLVRALRLLGPGERRSPGPLHG